MYRPQHRKKMLQQNAFAYNNGQLVADGVCQSVKMV